MTIVFKQNENSTTTVSLDEVLNFLSKVVTEDREFKINLSAELGRKYIRIVETSEFGSRSVYCFLDFGGNIYKSASWKVPAKHVRGTVFDAKYSYGKGLGPYGAVYLTGVGSK